jgi:predicted DNA-binding transcriptional regulator AlpA
MKREPENSQERKTEPGPEMSWVSAREAAKRLAVTRRHLDRLIAKGILPRPTFLGSRRFWLETDLQAAEVRRQFHTRTPRASGGPKAIERKRSDAELARAFFACWEAAGLSVALSLVKAEGADRPGQLPRGVHNRLSQTLRRAAAMGHVLPR